MCLHRALCHPHHQPPLLAPGSRVLPSPKSPYTAHLGLTTCIFDSKTFPHPPCTPFPLSFLPLSHFFKDPSLCSCGHGPMHSLIHSNTSDDLLLCARLGAGAANRAPLPPSPKPSENYMWETNGGSTYPSVSLLAVLDWKTGRTTAQQLPLPTCTVQAHPPCGAVCRHSPATSQGVHCLTPMEPDRGDTKHWAFLHKIGEFLHLLRPNQQMLREP